MNENLQLLMISGYGVACLLGLWVGYHSGFTDNMRRGRPTWVDVPFVSLTLVGLFGVVLMLVALVAGFIEGVT